MIRASFPASNVSLNAVLVVPAITLLILYLYSEHVARDAGLEAVPLALRPELEGRLQDEHPSVWGMPERFRKPPSDRTPVHEEILVLLSGSSQTPHLPHLLLIPPF